MRAPSAAPRGSLVSVASSVGFAAVYLVTPVLAPLPAESIWAVRWLLTLPVVTVALCLMRDWRSVSGIWERVRRRPVILLGILLAAALLSAQLWLFGWAPLNGRALQVALGYFLMPLVLVFVGRVLYGDRMNWWQWLAVSCAGLGVIYEVLRVGSISWETLLVALGYPAYFVLRRRLGIGHLGGMWWELIAMVPVAVLLLGVEVGDGTAFAENPSLRWLAPAFAVLAGVALLLYVWASRLLSMSVFGLLSYVEPALLVVVSLAIGERISGEEWVIYGAIWSAVLVLVVGGAVSLRRPGEAG
ncbi:EamA family transporter RarD [Leucobacter weissii]|uniref:EamA family transporter RarD n=1 Tax=Leucobacter weissii TaxID=1983706 RepID=A0A939SAI0_9MICO|nr:EamA family transporter RarD [Leucobacter weissii]